MPNKWFNEFLPPHRKNAGGKNQPDTLDTLSPMNIESKSLPIYIQREEIMTTEVKIINGRKVYDNGAKQLLVWSREVCEERIKQLFASTQNHADFLLATADWVAKQPDEMHEKWAGDCLMGLHAAYDRIQALEQSKPVEEQPKPSGNPVRPKLFGAKK